MKKSETTAPITKACACAISVMLTCGLMGAQVFNAMAWADESPTKNASAESANPSSGGRSSNSGSSSARSDASSSSATSGSASAADEQSTASASAAPSGESSPAASSSAALPDQASGAVSNPDATPSAASSSAASSEKSSGAASSSSASSGKSSKSSSAAAAKLDPSALRDGTYTVAVSLRNASDVSAASMARSAIDGTVALSVVDGSYVLELGLGTVQMGEIEGHVSEVDYYPTFSVTGGMLQVSGNALVAWESSDGAAKARIPVPDSAKQDGYIALQLHSDEMPVSPQKAVLAIDWSSIAKTADEPAVGPAVPAAPAKEAQPEPEPQPAPEPEAEKFGGVFEVGHLYTVPISFLKSGTGEMSMANQYFGGFAYVRMLENGTFDVRFSTNRPDYVEALSYYGSAAGVTADSGSSREFVIYVAATTADIVVPLSMTIKPMVELGAGDVSADMYLYFSRASDAGEDGGQVSSGGGALPATGDAPYGTLAFAMAALAAAGVLVSRTRREGE